MMACWPPEAGIRRSPRRNDKVARKPVAAFVRVVGPRQM